MHLPCPDIKLRQVDETTLAVSSGVFAKGVYLFHPDPEIALEDNCFDLPPGEKRLLAFGTAVSASDFKVFVYHH